MLGTIFYSAAHKGNSFTLGAKIYHLCNGAVLSRAAYPALSFIWPSGAYGSNDVSVVLPDLSNGFYLRGADMGRGADPNVSTRYTPSGISPSGQAVGSFQFGSLKNHVHTSGYQPLSPGGSIYGDKSGPWAGGSAATAGPANLAPGTVVGSGLADAFEFSYFGAYPYICIQS